MTKDKWLQGAGLKAQHTSKMEFAFFDERRVTLFSWNEVGAVWPLSHV
jgi:hypothetical protein